VRIKRKIMVYAATAMLAAAAGTLVMPGGASAHGAMMVPGSRTYLCWKDGTTTSGNIQPKNPACAAAVARSGSSSLYNWFAVLRSDGAGRTRGFIPDGQLCSGGTGGPYDFAGYNLARNDFPVTHLTSGAALRFDYNNWAKHPGTFYTYITRDSWSPTRPLAWSDLEATPFYQVTNPTSIGGPGTNDGRYSWTANLPSGKTGRHIIYSVWSRSDSQETFYGCSDVVFDGGRGEVTGVGDTTLPPPDPGPGPTDPTTPPAAGSCTATYAPGGSWSNGFGANVTVRAGNRAVNGWTVSWTFPGGQTVSTLWGGRHTANGSLSTVQNESYNGSVAANASTTFGFNGNGTAPTAVNNLTCTAS
jgi:chitin-binding protein